MRSWYFAKELAKRGHRVVQICEWRDGTEPAPPPETMTRHLQTHDWSAPLLLAIRPQKRALLERIRSPLTPAPLRKGLVTWSYLRHTGMFTDFSQAVQPYLQILARDFRPQAAWGLFGNTECWLIAQRLARLAGCPWIADMKDSWEVFMRRPLQGLMARRFQDMAASTANAEFNAQVLKRWFPTRPVVVYSGVDPCFFDAAPESKAADTIRLTLTGGIYDEERLNWFISGLATWLSSHVEYRQHRQTPVEVIYAGGDHARVERALHRLEGLAKLEIRGYLPLAELAALCRSATANAYIWCPNGFHHKLLELLACGRPVIAFPGETEESRGLADAAGGELHCPASAEAVTGLLARIAERGAAPIPIDPVRDAFSWAAQAMLLEQVLAHAGGGHKA